ncbi:hypothetical protein BGX31_004713 [Mortierella sp. GBA43]|nr:hypothetical protein BGX31_004713 [Mortierella sp. GBA43]
MHHKLFDLVAFYVVMFAINGQITSLPARLEWIGFCVQSIVALRRAFQTSIKHGIGLTSFLGMLDLLVGQLFLHQDRLGLLPTVANILVYFYVINLTRGLVFGDSVSCLLWFLFGLVDIYRKDPSPASILDLTPYKVIPVHTVGFGLYILMSELVDVMLHSAEPDPIQGRHIQYVGAQKNSMPSSRRPLCRSTDPASNVRFELCITEITPFTVSLCLNAVSDLSLVDQSSQDPASNSTPASASTLGSQSKGSEAWNQGDQVGSSSSSASASRQSKGNPPTPRIISTSDIVIHVNYIPWQQVQYHFPDEQSFIVYGLTPSTDYEIVMRVHQFSSNVTRVGTRAAPAGMCPAVDLSGKASPPNETAVTPTVPVTTTKNQKTRKNKKNQKGRKDVSDKGDSNKTRTAESTVSYLSSQGTTSEATVSTGSGLSPASTSTNTETIPRPSTVIEDQVQPAMEVSSNQILVEQLQASIHNSVEAANAIRASFKKLKRDQGKQEALLRQEIEAIGRNQAKATLQDQKRRQKLSFVQEAIKQADAQTSKLRGELDDLREQTRSIQPTLDTTLEDIKALDQRVLSTLATTKAELAPLKAECQRLQAEIKRLEGERMEWTSKSSKLRDGEVAPLQLRLQRLEQQEVVWKVAAEASKAQDEQVNLKIMTLEEDVHKKTLKSQELEGTIQQVQERNVQLLESLEQEKETLERLERESDAQEAQGSAFAPQPSMFTSPYSSPMHRHLDVMLNGSIRENYLWMPVGNGMTSSSGGSSSSNVGGSGSSVWPSAGNLSTTTTSDSYARPRTAGQRHSVNALATDSRSWWDMPSAVSLDSSRTTRTNTSSAPVTDRGLSEQQ